MFYNNITGQILRRRSGSFFSTEPPEGSFFHNAWEANQDYYDQTLQTAFIQGIGDNTLNPDNYSKLIIVDIYYCFRAVENLKTARAKVPSAEEALQALFDGLISGYEEYLQFLSDTWYIIRKDGIVPTPNFLDYSDFEENTATNEDPIYTLVAYIPCYYLWYNLAKSLADSLQANNKDTLYTDWIEGNSDPTPGYDIGNFIEEWKNDGKPWDEEKAQSLYRKSMFHEFTAFNEAVS